MGMQGDSSGPFVARADVSPVEISSTERRWSRQRRLAYQILVPVLGTIFLIATIPFVVALVQSLTSATGRFVGLQNYILALQNVLLYESIGRTLVYGAIVLPSEILFGLGLALLLHRQVRSAAIRVVIYILAVIPLVVPPVAVGVVARLVYAPGYGVLNQLLLRAGLIHQEIRWLGDPTLATLAVASVDIWQWTPFVYLVLFSGLQTVPQEAVEAAQVDGAGGWAQFWYIELPYLQPLFILIFFFRLADVLRAFDHIFILTGGGPGTTTQLLSIYLYRVEFKFNDTPQAAALAVVVMVVISLFYSFVTRVLPLERN
ncbi:MAG: sugar ABC transporter permease [Chloroflexi bacterium]|nr:sugar ABC transporter permease [Chloroflexota bacterium]